MKHKIPAIWQWIIIVLMILTVFSGFAACAALDQLTAAREKTEREQKNLMEQLEFRLAPDVNTYQSFRKDENNEEKNQQ